MPLPLTRHQRKTIVAIIIAASFCLIWLMQDNRWIRSTQEGRRGVMTQRIKEPERKMEDVLVLVNNKEHTTRSATNNQYKLEQLQSLAQAFPAAAFVWQRYQAYEALGDGARWKFRGAGYLYWTHGRILEATFERKTKVIVIRDINIVHDARNDDCHLLSLWVRIAGPEIFAGKPTAVIDHQKKKNVATNTSTTTTTTDDDDSSSVCHWEFPVPHLQIDGEYHIDVKLLVWNGQAPIRLQPSPHPDLLPPTQCLVQHGVPSNETLSTLFHEGIRAFKLYDPVPSCCEFCTRMAHCTYWATPPVHFEASFVNNGCEFFFDNATLVIPPSKHLGRTATIHQQQRRLDGVPTAYGPPHNGSVAYFMGCGWSYWFTLDYPCVSGDLDDRVFVVEPTIRYTNSDHHHNNNNNRVQTTVLPLCTKADERGLSGRWVRRASNTNGSSTIEDCPPYRRDNAFAEKFDIVEFTPDKPHCWHRDNFAIIGNRCTEMNCRLIPPKSIWRSSVHEETDWVGVWKPYSCDYLEYTTNQLQLCITQNKILSMDVAGKSIAEFLNEYLQQRLQGITMYKPERDDDDEESGSRIVLTTLGALHWASKSDEDLSSAAEAEIQALLLKYNHPTLYLVPGFFLSSERALHTHVDRMQKVNSLLEQRSETILEAFSLSAAFTFDTATQNDGMHIIGPTMKMIIIKLFHHICSTNTEGTRVGSVFSKRDD